MKMALRAYERALLSTLEKQGPFAVVHSHIQLFSGFVLKNAAKQNIPIRLAHSHTTEGTEKRPFIRTAYTTYMRWLINKHATHIFGCSRPACEALMGKKCWSDPRVQVLHNAIDLSSFENCADREILRQEFNISKERPIIGHVGSFRTVKNHRFLIEIFEQLAPRLDANLVLIGDGPLMPEMKKLIETKSLADRTRFLGSRSDVPCILQLLDLFLFPSQYEGLGIALVEAQAAGVPCLAAETIPAEVDMGLGLVNFLSLSKNAQLWAQTVEDLLEIPRPSWNVRRNALVKAGYDIKQLSQFVEEIYANG